MHRHDLLDEKLQRGGWVHLSPIVLPELQGRPAVLDLPEDVRKQESESDHATDPRPQCTQMSPGWSEQQGDEDRESEEQHGNFSQQSQAYDKPEKQPQSRQISLEN